MNKEKVIVTGSMGFVGMNLANLLHEQGYDVIGVDNLSTNDSDYYVQQMKRKKFIKQYICNIEDLHSDVFKNVRFVFHLGAKARVQNSLGSEYDYMNNNIVSTSKIVTECSIRDIKLIFISSSSVISDTELSPYSTSKLIGENIVRDYHNGTVVRLFNVYGHTMPTKGANSTLIGRIIHAKKHGEKIDLFGDGSKSRDFTNVDQVVDRLVRIAENKNLVNENKPIELGTGKSISVIDIINKSGIEYNSKKALTHESKETCARTHTYLGYRFRVDQMIFSFIENI